MESCRDCLSPPGFSSVPSCSVPHHPARELLLLSPGLQRPRSPLSTVRAALQAGVLVPPAAKKKKKAKELCIWKSFLIWRIRVQHELRRGLCLGSGGCTGTF